MAVFKIDPGAYVISSGGGWLPGVYESERAAREALHFSDEQLCKLQDEINEREPDHEKRTITFGMLQSLRNPGNG